MARRVLTILGPSVTGNEPKRHKDSGFSCRPQQPEKIPPVCFARRRLARCYRSKGCVKTRNLDQAVPGTITRSFLPIRYAGRTALCPEMSVAPAAVQTPAEFGLMGPLSVRFVAVTGLVTKPRYPIISCLAAVLRPICLSMQWKCP
jgi:hypothetical protein